MLKFLGLVKEDQVNKEIESKIKLVAEEYTQTLKRIQDSYDKSLARITDEYNNKLEKLEDTLAALQKENDDLLEDLALSLHGYEIPKRSQVVLVSIADCEKIQGATIENTTTPNDLLSAVKALDEKNATIRETHLKMLDVFTKTVDALEKKAKENGQSRGAGEIDLIDLDGKPFTKKINDVKELRPILKDAKAGKFYIAQQTGF